MTTQNRIGEVALPQPNQRKIDAQQAREEEFGVLLVRLAKEHPVRFRWTVCAIATGFAVFGVVAYLNGWV